MEKMQAAQKTQAVLPIEIEAIRPKKSLLTPETISALEEMRAQARTSRDVIAFPAPEAIKIGFIRHKGAITSTSTATYGLWVGSDVQMRRLSHFSEAYRRLAGYALATCLDDVFLTWLCRRWMRDLPEGRNATVRGNAICTDRSVLLHAPSFEVEDGPMTDDRLLEAFRRDVAASMTLYLRPDLSAHEEIEEIARMTPLIDSMITQLIREAQENAVHVEENFNALDHMTWRFRRAARG